MTYQYPDTCLLIFARAPLPGKVKTRLIPALGDEGACQLYQQMALKIVDDIAGSKLCEVKLLCHPDTSHPFFIGLERRHVLKLELQQGDDLGARMFKAIQNALKKASKVIVIGSDCPEYSVEYIEAAIQSLDDNDVVIGPAIDGGYVLIGVKTPEPSIFKQMDWGQNTVLHKTIEKIVAKNLIYQLLPPLHDIDVPADLRFLK